MKEHGILFKPELIQAILDGRKTQTRRIIKPQPKHVGYVNGINYDWVWMDLCFSEDGLRRLFPLAAAPYQPGDRLYVKEACLCWWNTKDGSFSHVAAYKRDGYELQEGEKWISPLFMPKAAARLWLEVTEVKVERVQEITHCDIYREGLDVGYDTKEEYPDSLKSAWKTLWISINGQESWDNNDWVYAYSFKRINKG